MGFDSSLCLRDGSTNLTSTETSPAASGASKGNLSLPAGVAADGMWLKAYFKTAFTGTSAVNTLHATSSPTGGTFTLQLGNLTTGAIAYNATTATIQSTLAALPSSSAPLVVNGVAFTQPLLGGTDITVSGGAFSAGDTVITFGGVLKYQPVVLVIGSGSLTGGSGYVVQSTTAGSQIKIQATDGTNVFDAACYLDGATPAQKDVAVRVDPAAWRLFGTQPMATINYKATVAGTITVAPVVIYLDQTYGRKS